jgi:iron(III) transport system permease protein
VPAYVSAYAWGDLTGVRGIGVAILVYTTTLYPYIYLSARSAFEAQSVCAMEAARVLGASSMSRFFAIALPMARPAIAAGSALAALEMAADFGAADHLGVQTLTTGIFKAWFSMGDLSAAARLSMILLVGVLALVWAERQSRAGAISGGSTRWRTPLRIALSGGPNMGVSLLCFAVLIVAFIVPVAHLTNLGLSHGMPKRDFTQSVVSTALLCGLGALTTLVIAGLGAFLARRDVKSNALIRTAALAGYATPGAVTALGILAALSFAGSGTGAILAGPLAVVALCYAYGARFAAAGLEPISAGLEKSTRSMREAALTLGTAPFARFLKLEAPLAAPSTFAAALIVAVEIAKELPATTLLRPFGFDTLAVRAHAYAADERLGAAAWPALAIVVLALVPTIIFSHGLSKSRAGQV